MAVFARAVAHRLAWLAVALLGAAAFAVLALARGERIGALWLVVAALCTYAVAYRFYGRFIARRVLRLDGGRTTPAVRHDDGLDYVPTNRFIVFGHHFAAIAGAGPLVGPVLAAQMGYLPGTIWILVGAVLAGAVQDFLILVCSMRRDARSLGEMIRVEMGQAAGLIAMIGVLMIMIILLAVLALVVVKALAGSPWGCFAVFATVPIALLMGLYARFLRPGRILEVSLIGFALLMLALVEGRAVAGSAWLAPWLTLRPETLAYLLIGYGFVASAIPVWLLLAPRDYLSTFLKIGTIGALAIGIVVTNPPLLLPPLTRFASGGGPVFAGSPFPFLFITIACGAVSGFHALIASGTTPKLIEDERQALMIGYGAMLAESFVAIMALIAASVLDPAVYFAMNSPAALIGGDATSAAHMLGQWGFTISPQTLDAVARSVGETSILSRSGGAPTLAVGMAHIFARIAGGQGLLAFWYHFAILFEALFILTTVDAGTRVARFMIQDLLGAAFPAMKRTDSWAANLIATALAVSAWGYFLYRGVVDPLGGVNTLWPLFGISNQMLAAIALMLATVILFRLKRQHVAWVAIGPTVWLAICTLSAGWIKLFSADPATGFLSHGRRIAAALDAGVLLAPARSMAEMRAVLVNDRVDAALCAAFMIVLVAILVLGIAAILRALADPGVTARETVEAAHATAS